MRHRVILDDNDLERIKNGGVLAIRFTDGVRVEVLHESTYAEEQKKLAEDRLSKEGIR